LNFDRSETTEWITRTWHQSAHPCYAFFRPSPKIFRRRYLFRWKLVRTASLDRSLTLLKAVAFSRFASILLHGVAPRPFYPIVSMVRPIMMMVVVRVPHPSHVDDGGRRLDRWQEERDHR
jgi:hypothetical protein